VTNEQLIFVSTMIGLFLVYATNRVTASSGAIGALAQTIQILRGELNAAEADRKKESEKHAQALQEEINKRKQLEIRFEKERTRYQEYIRMLLDIMRNSGIENIPEWNVED